MSKIILEEQAAPSAPGSALVAVYVKANAASSGATLFWKDDTGVEFGGAGFVKAFCNFTSTGTVNYGYRVTGVTDIAVGFWDINFEETFTDNNFPVVAVTSDTAGRILTGTKASTQTRKSIWCVHSSTGAAYDPDSITAIASGSI